MTKIISEFNVINIETCVRIDWRMWSLENHFIIISVC